MLTDWEMKSKLPPSNISAFGEQDVIDISAAAPKHLTESSDSDSEQWDDENIMSSRVGIRKKMLHTFTKLASSQIGRNPSDF